VVTNDEQHGGPVAWSSTNGMFVYMWPANGNRLHQYQFTNNTAFKTTAYAQSPTVGGSGSPGGIMTVTANGTNAASGILWAVVNTSGDANQATVPGTLHAYRATNVTNELWNSDLLPRDALGNLAKFVPPTAVNGKIYMATFSSRVNVYGLYPPPVLNVTISGSSTILTWPTNTPIGYTLQTATNPVAGPWTAVTNAVLKTNGLFRITLPLPATNPADFYRLKL
jgi:hypothetical protein